MERREFLRGVAGVLLVGTQLGSANSADADVEDLGVSGNEGTRIGGDSDNPLWLGFPSDGNEVWLSAGLLLNVRERVHTAWIAEQTQRSNSALS